MDPIKSRTYRIDCGRALFQGVLEACWLSFGVLFIIRVFDCDHSLAKSLGAIANFAGLLLSPWLIFALSRFIRSHNRAIAFTYGATGLALAIAALFPRIEFFLSFFILAAAINDQAWPYLSSIYKFAYSKKERGRLTSHALMLSVLSAALFSWGAGYLLDFVPNAYGLILGFAALACIAAASLSSLYPNPSHAPTKGIAIELNCLWRNKLMGLLSLSWFLLGMGNMMILPLRINYLTMAHFSNSDTVFYVATIPLFFRLISTPIWGWLYDRHSFYSLRNSVALCFGLGITFFFISPQSAFLWTGSILTGIGMGGGFLLWQLWLTRFFPQDKIPGYMAVNSLLTGIRGVSAPFIGFYLLQGENYFSVLILAIVCLSLSCLIIPEVKGKESNA